MTYWVYILSQVHTIIKFKGSMITIMKVCIAYLERQYRKHKTENDGNDILEAKPKFHLHFILAAWVFRSFSPSPTFFCTCTPLESSSGFTPCTKLSSSDFFTNFWLSFPKSVNDTKHFSDLFGSNLIIFHRLYTSITLFPTAIPFFLNAIT